MDEYVRHVEAELLKWRQQVLKKSNIFSRSTKKMQTKMNQFIPEKVHNVITESMKAMVKTTLVGSNLVTNKEQAAGLTLFERDQKLQDKLSLYRKTAVVEGAGTGAGGILLGLADFPLLLSIKMKFLFEAAAIYSFDTRNYDERLFLLHVFSLAFSNDSARHENFAAIEYWDDYKKQIDDVDWKHFQQQYRDHIDIVKMLQLVPGFGAVVGAFANYNLLDQLGTTAMNCYRLRYLQRMEDSE